MRIFDPHIHMNSRSTDDYEAMYADGARAAVELVFWMGRPRTSSESFYDYFDALLGWEPYRATQFGIQHFCTSALDSMTPEEDEALARRLQLAVEHGLPALVHTPHRDKATGTRRTLDVVRESGIAPDLVVLDHLNELTVGMVLDSGCWAGFSMYPRTKMSEDRMVEILKDHGTQRVLVNSAADRGRSDPLKTRRTADAMLAAGFDEAAVERVMWSNPVAFYGQSGRLEVDPALDEPKPDDQSSFEGNSIRRGGV
ncbi:TatD family hydrolase [Streptomyces dysideae]|uniref:Hydrolase TatD n=1 Tax=Streptomyces dysideae TaxID=909626 RepID=A0A101V091_9ACTN|nr:hydrolase TatD [Streptomyces dysideae]KUO20084.1 hydrolase TatD [Streptomyces dysideae]